MATAIQPASSKTATKTSALTLWHLLSLDAPTVAALWVWTVARAAHMALPWIAPTAMFLAVWMLYAADRLLDALHPSGELEERHRFHHRHRNRFLTGIAMSAVLLVSISRYSYPQAVRLYALLGALLAAWFILIHARISSDRRLPKEIAVGLFFPAAVFIPTVAHRPDLRIMLLPHAILFAMICSLNCLFIYAWEHPGPRLNAHWTTRQTTRHLPLITLLTMIAALGLIATTHRFWQLDAACALSAIALLSLHLTHRQIASTTLRAAADLSLLTPILLLPWLR